MISRILSFSLFILLLLCIPACEGDQHPGLIESKGIVRDYTGLDGCGYIIELPDGERLEPFYIDSSVVLFDGQHILVKYSLLSDHASICMVGNPARIYSIIEIGCSSINQVSIDFPIESLPDDPFDIDSVVISSDCLDIMVWYSGGCRPHNFSMVELPGFCGTPPFPPPTLLLCHDANGDACEAYIGETVSFDLTSLQVQDTTAVTFNLLLNFPGSSYIKTITYNY